MEVPEAKRAKIESSSEPMAVDNDAQQQRDGDSQAATLSMRAMMKIYYRRLFPTQQLFKWLAYGNDSGAPGADPRALARRELCFTLDGDVFVRYQSFKNVSELAGALASRVPSKIDIGPIYTCDPRDRAKYMKDFKPLARELVFDIDMTDYDDVRTCGSGGHICNKCWGFMAVAIQVLDTALRQDFGFKHILWVFSGRRGVHCWVCDAEARSLMDDVRSGIVGYLSVVKGVVGDKPKLAMGFNRHPSLDRAYTLLKEAWIKHLVPEQRLLEDPRGLASLLRFVPDGELVAALTSKWGVAPDASSSAGPGPGDGTLSIRRWHQLVEAVEQKAATLRAAKNVAAAAALSRCVSDIVFGCCYPRLDAEVSKKMNHLLKAPFCVHPKTGKVCVPLDPADPWSFDPEDGVPKLQQLVAQLERQQQQAAAVPGAEGPGAPPSPDAFKGDAAGGAGGGWQSTSLAPAIHTFIRSFLDPLMTASQAALAAAARQAAASREAEEAERQQALALGLGEALVPAADLTW